MLNNKKNLNEELVENHLISPIFLILLCCFNTCIIPFNIIAIVLSNKYPNINDQCTIKNNNNLSIWNYLNIYGFANLGIALYIYIMIFIIILIGQQIKNKQFRKIRSMLIRIFIILFKYVISIFNLSWFIIGIILISQLNKTCRDHYHPLFILLIIIIIVQGLSVLGNCTINIRDLKREYFNSQVY